MGSRGEGWVIGQFVIGAAILAVSLFTRTVPPLVLYILGAALMLLGACLAGAGLLYLGPNLSPFPRPRENGGALVTTGVYALVRHPIYSGIALGAIGWSLWWGSLPALALALLLVVWFDLKSRREERWLVAKYPGYEAYRARVKKLVPFIY